MAHTFAVQNQSAADTTLAQHKQQADFGTVKISSWIRIWSWHKANKVASSNQKRHPFLSVKQRLLNMESYLCNIIQYSLRNC